ncbi:MAG TPA: HAD-IB family hydrolase [Candidatus Aphodousia faecavium]|nr:HAD-IB family hydrolase [Candidatus Aphodousia faecavium]
MKLAIFDMDGTLMPIDVGVVWVDFLAQKSGADLSAELALSKRYLEDYRCGRFQVEPFMHFHMRLLARFSRQNIERLRQRFVEEEVLPNVTAAAKSLVEAMREDGYTPVMATGTQAFISSPVAKVFGIEHLLATRPVEDARGEFTGEFTGGFCYGVHKIDRLKEFCLGLGMPLEQLSESVTYTDSITDLPLLQFVESFHGHVVATNPDPLLKEQAQKSGWTVLTLFNRA